MIKKIRISDSAMLWLIALPAILHMVAFKYVPMLGNVIAFQNFNVFLGVLGSPWVGLEHFIKMFAYQDIYKLFGNTLMFSLYYLVFGFPAPLVLALILNELRWMMFKRTLQTVLYLPHFLSWVIVGGLFINLVTDYLTSMRWFVPTVVSIGIWKEVGWGMIIYLAALAGINPNLYEAAMVDGAGRWRQMWNITLPSLTPAIVVLLLLNLSSVLDTNVEQLLMFLNPLVRDVGEVIDTYVYRVGLVNAQYSYTTAIAMFKSLVALLLVVGMNAVSKKATGESIY